MNPDMEAAADLGNPEHNPYAHTPPTASGINGRDLDAGSLAFYVRDLLDAAGYNYEPDQPLHDQVRECCAEIRDGWEKRRELDRLLVVAVDRHAAEKQRLTDLVDELRKHVDSAVRRAEQAEAERDRLLDQAGAST